MSSTRPIHTKPINFTVSAVIDPAAEMTRKLMHNEKNWVCSFTEWVLSKLGVIEKGSVSDFNRSVSLLKISSNADRKLQLSNLHSTQTGKVANTCTQSCQKQKEEAEKEFYRALSDRCARLEIKDQTQLYFTMQSLFKQQDLAQPSISQKQFKTRISPYWPKESNSKGIAWGRVASLTAKVGIGALLAYGAYKAFPIVNIWLGFGYDGLHDEKPEIKTRGSTIPTADASPICELHDNEICMRSEELDKIFSHPTSPVIEEKKFVAPIALTTLSTLLFSIAWKIVKRDVKVAPKMIEEYRKAIENAEDKAAVERFYKEISENKNWDVGNIFVIYQIYIKKIAKFDAEAALKIIKEYRKAIENAKDKAAVESLYEKISENKGFDVDNRYAIYQIREQKIAAVRRQLGLPVSDNYLCR